MKQIIETNVNTDIFLNKFLDNSQNLVYIYKKVLTCLFYFILFLYILSHEILIQIFIIDFFGGLDFFSLSTHIFFFRKILRKIMRDSTIIQQYVE